MQSLPGGRHHRIESAVPATILNKQTDRHNLAPMNRLQTKAATRRASHVQRLREAILLVFCEPLPAQCSVLKDLTVRQWQPLMHWLDTSGLALYFLDRLTDLELCAMLPPAVLSRLRQNLADNTARTRAMMIECAALHHLFQRAGLTYATLKGFSLWPISVPKPELRSQLDLDFMVAEESAAEARKILEAMGYRLHAISGNSWEFKSAHPAPLSLKTLYTIKPQRSIELHIETQNPKTALLLPRTESRYFYGVWMPVLSPVDLFIRQGRHAYKHVCSAFSRAAHLIEFRRHVLVRHHDTAFWNEVRERAEGGTKTAIALGVVINLISQVMGDFAPEALTCWTADRLPTAIRAWVEVYGSRVVLGDFPGSKLYLLLQKETEALGIPSARPLRRALLPFRLPSAITHAEPDESAVARMQRNARQLRFVIARLRFHAVEGVRYLCESFRWRRHLNCLTSQSGHSPDRASFTGLPAEEVGMENNQSPR
jgi:hypothetical protein